MTPRVTTGSLAAIAGGGGLPRLLAAIWLAPLAACAVPVESGPPIADPVAAAAAAAARRGVGHPATLRFEWRYGDRRGDVRGEGVARFNPPDSLRLDLFTSGDVAMAAALAGGGLEVAGQIEDVELPPTPFLFAMAGLFRPQGRGPEGFLADGDSVLVYRGDAVDRYYFLNQGRLRRVEERRSGRRTRRLEIEWPAVGEWPQRAAYRDLAERSRAEWRLTEARTVERHPSGIYALDR